MGRRIKNELADRERQAPEIKRRMTESLEEFIRDEKDLAITRMALNLLTIAEQIRAERGFSEDTIMDETFNYIFKGGQYSLTAFELRSILAGEQAVNSIDVGFSNIKELGSARYYLESEGYRLPTELTFEFLNKLGFIEEGRVIKPDDLISEKEVHGYRFITQHPTLPFEARCEVQSVEYNGQVLFRGFSINYQEPGTAK